MNPIKLICCLFVCSSSIAQAAIPCDTFQIAINNQSSDNLLATKIHLSGATIEPKGIHKLDSNSSQIFTIHKSRNGVAMNGEMIFHSMTLPSKKAKIKFSLNNAGLVCQHDDKSADGDYSINKTRIPNRADYTIS